MNRALAVVQIIASVGLVAISVANLATRPAPPKPPTVSPFIFFPSPYTERWLGSKHAYSLNDLIGRDI